LGLIRTGKQNNSLGCVTRWCLSVASNQGSGDDTTGWSGITAAQAEVRLPCEGEGLGAVSLWVVWSTVLQESALRRAAHPQPRARVPLPVSEAGMIDHGLQTPLQVPSAAPL
jgi:hypothetical protein